MMSNSYKWGLVKKNQGNKENTQILSHFLLKVIQLVNAQQLLIPYFFVIYCGSKI